MKRSQIVVIVVTVYLLISAILWDGGLSNEINYDNQKFSEAYKAGDKFTAVGTVVANKPVTHELIEGEYMMISVKRQQLMEGSIRCRTGIFGRCTRGKPQWVTIDSNFYESPSYTFLGEEILYWELSGMNPPVTKEVVDEFGIKYVFETLPVAVEKRLSYRRGIFTASPASSRAEIKATNKRFAVFITGFLGFCVLVLVSQDWS